jgi:hypothetical protein
VPLHLPDAEETSGTRKPLPEELRAPLALRFKVTATLLALGESGPGGLTGAGNALAFKPPTCPYDILSVDLVGSHGRCSGQRAWYSL